MPHFSSRFRLHILAAASLLLAIALVAPSASLASAAAPAPIQGTWNFQGGAVLVQAQPNGSFVGTVSVKTTFGSCPHPVGQQIWQITGSGLSYSGGHLWLHANCAPNAYGDATWNIVSTNPTTYTMTFCTAPPGSGAPNPTNPQANGTECFTLTRALSPGETPPAPANTSLPTISGKAKAGDKLTCSNGTWTNNPSAYHYAWFADGTPIAGATSSTYVVKTANEGLQLTCAVTAFNNGGAGPTATSKPIAVPVPFVAKCPAATGKISATKLGLVKLGMTRKQARTAYVRSSNRGKKYQDFFCLTPIGVRVGYASPALLRTLSRKVRKRVAGRVVLALTANAFYAVGGIRPGATLTAAKARFGHGRTYHVGLNDWYIAPDGGVSVVMKVRDDLVQEIGIGAKQLTLKSNSQRTFIRSFD